MAIFDGADPPVCVTVDNNKTFHAFVNGPEKGLYEVNGLRNLVSAPVY